MHSLKRYPVLFNDPLQAWDSADQLILEHVQSEDLRDKRILIINDHFGALSCGLNDFNINVYTDSYISSKAISLNSQGTITSFNHLDQLNGFYDFVLIRLPKNLSFFEDILCHLTHHITPDSKLIFGSMVKHLSKGSFELIEKYIGPTKTSLAQKKARLIFSSFIKVKTESSYPIKLKLEGFDKEFINHSNLFSREKLDIGTRFLLENMPRGPYSTVLDLGCANGIVGIKAKMLMPQARIIFSDESAMAIESARVNYHTYFEDGAEFHWTNCYEDGVKDSVDLVICNPPFHQNHNVGDQIAWQMFVDAHRVLRKGGLMRVIGNSHLSYQVKLKKIFGNSKLVATNSKFMIIDCLK